MSSQKLFPCLPGLKKPALEGDWKQHATDDEATIRGWEEQGYNLALHLEDAGLCVIDIDGPEGEAAWAALDLRLPPTYEVKSPRGRHIYYRGALRASVSKLAHKVDTRGLGSYVLVPGCETEHGRYEVLSDRPIADLPAEIPERLARATNEHTDRAAASVELDLPVNVSRAERHLAALEPLVQGEGADERMYEIACALREFAISRELAEELALEHLTFDPFDPDRTPAFIARKLDNAWSYAQNEAGAWAVGDLAQTFGSALDKLPEDMRQGPDLPPDPFHAYSEAEQDAMTPPVFLRQDVLPLGVVALYGAPGTFKSFLALDLGLTIAAGLPGWGAAASEQSAVVYVAGEGPRSIARIRRPAWRAVRGVEGSIPFHIVTNMPQAAEPANVQAFIGSLKKQEIRPRLVVVDTYARFMVGLKENDPGDAQKGVAALEAIQRAFGCTVLVIHHTGKNEDAGMRGSNALLGGVDAVHKVNRPSPTSKAVEVVNERQKDADTRSKPWFFEGQEIAGSLVFREIDAKTYRDLTVTDHEMDGRLIGAALVKLKAIGRAAGVSTHALATTLRPVPIDEPATRTLEENERTVRKLRAHAKHGLRAYCDKDEKGDYRWFLADEA